MSLQDNKKIIDIMTENDPVDIIKFFMVAFGDDI